MKVYSGIRIIRKKNRHGMTRCIWLLYVVPLFLACSDGNVLPSPVLISHGTFIDSRDNKVYQSVSLEGQTWMAENMAYIPYVSRGNEQGGIWVYGYNGNRVDSAIFTSNYQLYRCLYDWRTAIKICPSGWHLPSDKDWDQLNEFLRKNGYEFSAGEALKSISGWISGRGLDVFGFEALPAGSRGTDGSFYYIGGMTSFWTSTESEESYAWVRRLDHTRPGIVIHTSDKQTGFSVRCIAD